jgi:hypothetical protein
MFIIFEHIIAVAHPKGKNLKFTTLTVSNITNYHKKKNPLLRSIPASKINVHFHTLMTPVIIYYPALSSKFPVTLQFSSKNIAHITEPLPSDGMSDTHTDTQTDGRLFIMYAKYHVIHPLSIKFRDWVCRE